VGSGGRRAMAGGGGGEVGLRRSGVAFGSPIYLGVRTEQEVSISGDSFPHVDQFITIAAIEPRLEPERWPSLKISKPIFVSFKIFKTNILVTDNVEL
jgi:hypothetical protein